MIEGRVLNSISGEPIRKVNLTLRASSVGGSGAAPPQSSAVASDAEGKFRFEKLEPGRYTLFAEKAGFVQQQYGARAGQFGPGTALTIGPSEKLRNLEFKLTPQAVISGKVVDEDGEPVPGVMMQAWRQTVFSARAMGSMGPSTTNDVGEFRIANLAPGKYILRAEHHRRSMFGPTPQMQGSGKEGVEDYVSTFYPASTDADAAVPIAVTAGQELSGVLIRLQKARVYRVRGKILGTSTDQSSRIQVMLQPQRRSGGIVMFGGGGGNVKPDGSFEVAPVQPGSYNLIVMRHDTGRPQTIGRLPVTVSNQNVDELIVQAGVPLEVAGKVTAEGDEKVTITGSVMLQPAEGIGFGIPPARIQTDGTFKFEGVSRDKYFVAMYGLPEGMYLKHVRAGPSDVLENGLDLSQSESAPPLEIVVSSKAATIDGIVRHEDKVWPGASIMLLPEPIRPERLRWTQRMTGSDQNGRFTLKGIAPGEYRLYAWEEYPSISELEPEQLKPYEGYAVKVKLGEEAREQVELKLARPQQN